MRSLSYRTWKRGLDVALSGVALVVLAPVGIAIAGGVWATLGRPILFRQERTGWREASFTLYKFRTLPPGGSPEDSPSSLAAFLRQTGLDELPQLVHVFRGQMSLVGPRPLLPHYLPYYTPLERARHAVRPGLTGWAQIHGRHRLDWDTRLQMDAWYVQHQSMRLDARILGRTLWQLVRRPSSSGPAPPALDVWRKHQAI
ncbi:MAG: sugar transferase [Bacteroidota bacterium]